MKCLPLLFLLVACASVPLTEEQLEERAYEEQERVLAFLFWKKQCLAQKNIIFVYKPFRSCRSGDCIPGKWDWRYDFKRERPMLGNTYQCITREQLQEIMRGV